jgi:hypothetical protein
MRGYVYFLENPAMPGLLKIGFTTTSLEQRLSELNTTGVPEEFVIGAAFLVSDAESCEKAVHALFSEYRIREQREFFRLSLKEALDKSQAIVFSNIESAKPSEITTAKFGQLDYIDEHIIEVILHSNTGRIWPEKLVGEYELGREQLLLHFGELVCKGFLKEKHEEYSLTHKGRKYAFDHNLVMPEILP